MATDEEIAERRQLAAEISNLESRINSALIEQQRLEEELRYVVAQLGVLNTAAQGMSQKVTHDVGKLSEKIGREDLDARDLLQLLHDVSERYFAYKNLSTATRNLTKLNDEYYTKFKFYHELRRIALGCVMAVDTNLISHETARKQVEKSYLANTDYWLAYAIAAVMLWWSDEREAAQRALNRAMMMDERKTSLLMLFCNLKFGRKDTAMRWYSYYLGCIHANDVGEEFQYLMEAQMSGSFGNDRELQARVASKIKDMFDEIALYSINFKNEVADAACRFMQTKAHVSDFDFFYLPEYCEQHDEMKALISDAEKNVLVAREYEDLAQEHDDGEKDVNEHLEDTIYNVIESMDDEEEKVHRRIRYNELIVAAKGDIHKAEVAYAERYPQTGPIGFAGLLKRWAFTEDDAAILPQTRRFALAKLEPDIRAGVAKFADGYRARERERYTISVDGWSMNCNENEATIAKEGFEEYYRTHSIWRYLQDRFVLVWIGMILAGILGLVIAAVSVRHPAVIVISVLLVLVGAFCLWRQIDNLREVMERRKRKSLEIIERTLDEMGAWRQAYKEADQGYADLMQALDLFTDDDE
ncbi:hypothetical protein [Bifidobacterium phasiani]|uniref:Uncharacterized protein n=1 Tax=Bifidobacterium phasiani TaxID=2834431 RepID=A0ABS6WAY4_9BIFI|nr:hypothetical protein [Bifidobacterium phasiani]MBW3083673.1 hypothetical protein [Bifidobacterium phasiani]